LFILPSGRPPVSVRPLPSATPTKLPVHVGSQPHRPVSPTAFVAGREEDALRQPKIRLCSRGQSRSSIWLTSYHHCTVLNSTDKKNQANFMSKLTLSLSSILLPPHYHVWPHFKAPFLQVLSKGATSPPILRVIEEFTTPLLRAIPTIVRPIDLERVKMRVELVYTGSY